MILTSRELLLIRHSFLFNNCDEEIISKAVSDKSAVLNTASKASVIYDENNFRRSFCILLSGEIDVRKNTADGRGLHINILKKGDHFGAAALFNGADTFPTILTANKACKYLEFPEELLLRLMRENFTLAENYMKYQSSRILFLNQRISALSAGTAEQRLISWLLEHIETADGYTVCHLNISFTSLANSLNIGRASLYRAIDTLTQCGAIECTEKTIRIVNPTLLRQKIDGG